MKLPNVEHCLVEEAKIRQYLLNPEHRFGASKAHFFQQFGFSLGEWRSFAVALQRHALENDIAKANETEFGSRYEVDGELITPDGRRPRIRTVWQVDVAQVVPRLITAHPLEPEQ